MSKVLLNDHDGITYAAGQRIGQPEQRTEILADVRMTVDGLTELCAKVRESWPAHIPLPQDLNALLCFQDFVIARVRNGCLKRFAEACAE
jgi:hypothetical protein